MRADRVEKEEELTLPQFTEYGRIAVQPGNWNGWHEESWPRVERQLAETFVFRLQEPVLFEEQSQSRRDHADHKENRELST